MIKEIRVLSCYDNLFLLPEVVRAEGKGYKTMIKKTRKAHYPSLEAVAIGFNIC